MRKNVILIIVSFIIGFSLGIPVMVRNYVNDFREHHLDYASGDKKEAVERDGDIEAYKFIVDSISKSEMPCNVFGYAFIMSVKHNYAPANYDIYKALVSAYGGYENMNDKMKYMAKYFLKRGASEDEKECIVALKELNDD